MGCWTSTKSSLSIILSEERRRRNVMSTLKLQKNSDPVIDAVFTTVDEYIALEERREKISSDTSQLPVDKVVEDPATLKPEPEATNDNAPRKQGFDLFWFVFLFLLMAWVAASIWDSL